MSFFDKLFKTETCPFFGKTVNSFKQLRIKMDGSQETTPSIDPISLSIAEKSIKYKDNLTGESFTFNWKFIKKSGNDWYFLDNHSNQWILSPDLITWTIIGERQNISFILSARHKSIQKLMDARLKELSITKGNTETEPLYSLWKCPGCGREIFDLIGIILSPDMSMKDVAINLRASPLSFLKNVASCDCNSPGIRSIHLVFTFFCVFNIKDKLDLQIHNYYTSEYGEIGTDVLIVPLVGKPQKLSIEQRKQLIGI